MAAFTVIVIMFDFLAALAMIRPLVNQGSNKYGRVVCFIIILISTASGLLLMGVG